MTNIPRQKLREIVDKYGAEICSDSKRCEGLLKDKCGSFRREIGILINALEERIPLDLLAARNSVPRELLLNRLAKRLEDNLALTAEAANWAVESWALALGVATETEIVKREIARTGAEDENKAQANEKTFQPDSSQKQSTTKPPMARPPDFAPPSKPIQSTVPFEPPIVRTPVQATPPSRNFPQPTQTQSSAPTQIPRAKRSWKFRGCFIGCFLLLILVAILIVGVPYTFQVMRQTQQQSAPSRVPQQ